MGVPFDEEVVAERLDELAGAALVEVECRQRAPVLHVEHQKAPAVRRFAASKAGHLAQLHADSRRLRSLCCTHSIQ